MKHPQQFYDPFFILNRYAPAHSNKERRLINKDVMHEQISLDRLVISEDFNYSSLLTENHTFAALSDWPALLDEVFHNNMVMHGLAEIHFLHFDVKLFVSFSRKAIMKSEVFGQSTKYQ